jgi:hypothetical protein
VNTNNSNPNSTFNEPSFLEIVALQNVKYYNNLPLFFLCFADNSYQGLSSHSDQFSIDLSNPIHIEEVKNSVKHLVNAVLKNKVNEMWKTPRVPGQ